MKHFSDIEIDFSTKKPQQNDKELIKTAEIVNKIFESLNVICPAFKQAWPTEFEFKRAKKEWIKALMLARLYDYELIKAGLDSLRLNATPFIPSPGEFIKLCVISPETYGVPSISKAFKEASINSHPCSDKNWSHETVYHAWKATGARNFTILTEKEAYKLFERNYEIAIRKWKNGERIEIPAALTEDTKGPVNKEVSKAYMKEMKFILGKK